MARRQGPGGTRGKSPPGRLRIVAGKWRGRLLHVPDAPGLRPTSERIRETLFNWLTPVLPGARCLDLFAGTGALGLEAMSRGAAEVVLVESNVTALRSLHQSVDALDADGVHVVGGDAYDYLRSAESSRFDIVFLDPPYAHDSIGELCRLMAERDWLAPGARVYFEQDRSQAPVALPEGWSLYRQKSAGQVRYSLARVSQHNG